MLDYGSKENRLGLSKSLHRGLTTTNMIESSIGGVTNRSGRVKRWKDGSMATRWAATSLLDAGNSFRRIMGYKDLWMLDAVIRDFVDVSDKVA